LEDEEENIWIRCAGHGLQKFSLTNERLQDIGVVQAFSKNVYDILRLGDHYWLGTSAGIAVYDARKNALVATITQANGLPGNVVYSIEQDIDGFIWSGIRRAGYH